MIKIYSFANGRRTDFELRKDILEKFITINYDCYQISGYQSNTVYNVLNIINDLNLEYLADEYELKLFNQLTGYKLNFNDIENYNLYSYNNKIYISINNQYKFTNENKKGVGIAVDEEDEILEMKSNLKNRIDNSFPPTYFSKIVNLNEVKDNNLVLEFIRLIKENIK